MTLRVGLQIGAGVSTVASVKGNVEHLPEVIELFRRFSTPLGLLSTMEVGDFWKNYEGVISHLKGRWAEGNPSVQLATDTGPGVAFMRRRSGKDVVHMLVSSDKNNEWAWVEVTIGSSALFFDWYTPGRTGILSRLYRGSQDKDYVFLSRLLNGQDPTADRWSSCCRFFHPYAKED